MRFHWDQAIRHKGWDEEGGIKVLRVSHLMLYEISEEAILCKITVRFCIK
jgi:hypothetical protein